MLLFGLRNKFTEISMLVIYYLTQFDGVLQSSFSVIPSITPANLCKPIYDIINYFIPICPFESGKCGKEEQKLQKIEYLENEKSFLDEIRHFSQFLKDYHLVEKKLIKNSGHKLEAPIPQNGQLHSKQFVGFCRRIVRACFTILWGWPLKG